MSTAPRRTDVTFPFIRRPAVGGPTEIIAGTTLGWTVAVGGGLQAFYVEVPLHPYLDRSQDIILEIGWAPVGSQAAKVMSWRIDVTAMQPGAILTAITATVDAVDIVVPAVVATYVETLLLIPAAALADPAVNEVHVRITRLVSSADPALDPGLHHVEIKQAVVR